MHFVIVSFTHKNTTLDIREKLAFSNDDQKLEFLKKASQDSNITEVMLTSTCNRIEIFASCTEIEDAVMTLLLHLHTHSLIPADELEVRAEVYEDRSAIHHFFSVVSSLDSMVVGETQIAGQTKDAYNLSLINGLCGDEITGAIRHAFSCAAEVRHVSDISSKPVSIASVAMKQLKKDAGDLDEMRALIIGAGEMSVHTARYLIKEGVSITIMNRTRAKAEDIAQEFDAQVIDFEELSAVLNEFDILVSATSATTPIISKRDINFNIKDRYWIDMAVPRDIEAFNSNAIKLYAVDDLKTIVDENLSIREDQAKASFSVIRKFTKEYYIWKQRQNIEPMIKELYVRAHQAAAVETARAVKSKYIPKEYEAQAQKLAEQALKRFMHAKMQRLREVSEAKESENLIASLKHILGLEKDETN